MIGLAAVTLLWRGYDRADAMREDASMITSMSANGAARAIEAPRTDRVKAGAAAAKVAASASDSASSVANPAAALAAQGAPIDAARVDAIRAKIAAGTYRIDPQAIAERMIAEDLPEAR